MTRYQVAAVWWPEGWEPLGPSDVPNCVRPSHARGASGPAMDLERVLATVRGLNRQNMDHPGAVWYVAAEVDDSAAR